MADEWGRRIAELADEAERNITEAPERTWGQFLYGLPLMPITRQKSPERSLADARQDYVLSRLAEEAGRERYSLARQHPGVAQALMGYEGKDPALAHLSKGNLQSPREWSVMGPGSAFDTATTVLQAPVGVATAIGDLAANVGNDAAILAMTGTLNHPARAHGFRGYGQAARDAAYHFNTFMDPLSLGPPIRDDGQGPPRNAWQEKERGRKAGDSIANWRDLSGMDRAIAQHAETVEKPELRTWMRGHKVQDLIGDYPTAALSFVGDNILNAAPPPLRAISAAARAGQVAKAGGQMALEFAPGALFEAGAAALPFFSQTPQSQYGGVEDEAMERRAADLRWALDSEEYRRSRGRYGR